MTCREVADFIMAYLDAELPARQRAELDAHLAECPDCVAYLESYETTVKLGKRAFADLDAPAEGELPERLVRAIVAARRTK